ncbi:VanZ family protein [Patescibacteria group bacterium]
MVEKKVQRLKGVINGWLPVLAWCSLLFYFSSIPNLKAAKDPWWDEIIRSGAHLFFYLVLYLLVFRAINLAREVKNFIWPLVLTIGYGFFDEVHQIFVPTRTFQRIDLLIDFSGGILGLVLIKGLLIIVPQKMLRQSKFLNRLF